MKRCARWLMAICIATVGNAAWAEPSSMGESIPPGEQVAIADIIASISRGYAQRTPTVKRMAHAKHHGCVRATFTVDNVPIDLRQGVFAKPLGTSFKAWMRLSNGSANEQHDSVPDTRGFAIKLIGVPGKKLMPDECDTQDFLMHNAPIFLVRDVASFAKYMALGADPGVASLLKAIQAISKEKPAEFAREAALGAQIVTTPIENPLLIPYYSALPASVGSQPVKFAVRPCVTGRDKIPFSARHPAPVHMNFLRESMKKQLDVTDACFEFFVQRRSALKDMPIEDPTVEWNQDTAPFVRVATIHIPKQSFDSDKQMAFCQDLAFTSWHTLAEHRPLGGINRLRKAAYEFSSKTRHKMNAATLVEPTGDEVFK